MSCIDVYLEEGNRLTDIVNRGGLDLPEGFHGVAIGKKEIDQLSRWGVAYEYEQQRFSR